MQNLKLRTFIEFAYFKIPLNLSFGKLRTGSFSKGGGGFGKGIRHCEEEGEGLLRRPPKADSSQ